MLKRTLVLFVAMAIGAAVTPVFADDYMGAVDQYKRRVDKYFESVKVYENSVDNKNRAADNLRASEQQQYAAPSPSPADEYAPAPQVYAAPAPVPVPVWGYRYYRYWDATLGDWIFAPIWCYSGWVPPYGWYPVSYNDRYQFRHFSRGWVNGGRLSFSRPVNLQPQRNMSMARTIPQRQLQMQSRPQNQARLQNYRAAQGGWRR